jgi:hypothetical protein
MRLTVGLSKSLSLHFLVLIGFDDGDVVARSGKRVCVEFPVWFGFLSTYRSVVRMILGCEDVEVGW